MSKKELTAEQIYKRNQKRSKWLSRLAPICFWGMLAIGIVCLFFAIKHSFGNIAEIIELLDDKKYTGEQLQTNYAFLINKYGEWTIGTGGSGFTITFINIGKALFSGLMITNLVLGISFIIFANLLGKWLLPKLSAQLLKDNQDMVNIQVLKSADKE